MSKDRFVTAQFCDDIRHEVNNKFSFIGCYLSELIVDEFPAVLPKLCTVVTLITPIEHPFEKLAIRAKLNDEQIAELPIHDLSSQDGMHESVRDGARFFSVTCMMVFSPLAIADESVLRIVVDTEDGEMVSPGLILRKRTDKDPQIIPA